VAVAGALGVVFYVAAWAVAGARWRGYDPATQAISELFARGAPPDSAHLLVGALVVTGLLLPPFAFALHLGLPGDGLAAPLAASFSGLCTVAIVAFPCTAGCPGFGSSFTDSMHTLVAGAGYIALVTVPLIFGVRTRSEEPGFARLSFVLGGFATAGFVLYTLGVVDGAAGLAQRTFNTTADLWYVLAAGMVIRRTRLDESPASAPT
jgi:hypothetical protein